MCDERPHRGLPPAGRRLSRRHVLQGMVSLAALAACTPGNAGGARAGAPTSNVPLGSRAPSADGLTARVMAMHLHASASEGVGSMRSHLAEAASHGFDVAWFTEHDWRRRRLLFRPTYSFVPGEVVNGEPWDLETLPPEGALAIGSAGSQVDDPVSPADPARRKASLRIRATGAGAEKAAVGHSIRATGGSRGNFRSRIAGRTEKVDVLAVTAGPDAWGEILLSLSHHPATGGRAAGVYAVRYRLRTDATVRSVRAEGRTAVVDVPVPLGRWHELTLDPLTDLTQAYPDMDSRDHSLHEIVFRGVSRRSATVDVCFGHLRFEEQDGYDAIGVENDLVARYASAEPVLGLIGTELSLGPHVAQYGGDQTPYDYGRVRRFEDVPGDDAYPSLVDHIHAAGGLASIAHPGVEVTTLLAQRTAADMIEVGFGRRGPDSIGRQLERWDTLSRNALFLTGSGASDDHTGQRWAEQGNRYYTAAWSSRTAQPELVDALAAGRVYVGYLGSFGGAIDMALDGTVPMGSVVVGRRRDRTLRVDVTGLPDGGAVQLVRGVVDRAEQADPRPGTSVVATYGAADLERATAVPLDVSDDCFHRLQVVDGSGAVVGYGQPIWTLAEQPPTGVPSRRLVEG